MKLKILLVEDNAIQASILIKMLVALGYDPPSSCHSYDEAIASLKTAEFHIAILDLHLAGEKDGVDVARYINKEIGIPVIFLTASSSMDALDYVKGVNPSAYLEKPIRQSDLFAAIEIALHKEADSDPKVPGDEYLQKKKFLFIRDNDIYHKVNFDDILYLSSNHVYVTIHTLLRTYLVRASLSEYALLLDPKKFPRAHRSHIINIDKVELISKNKVTIKGVEIQISKSYQKELLKTIGGKYRVLVALAGMLMFCFT